MSDDELRRLAEALTLRAANGFKPLVIQAPDQDHEHIRATLQRWGVPDAAIVIHVPPPAPAAPPLVVMTPQERVRLAMAVVEAHRNDPYRRARACHAAADSMLDRYRHNDPEVAARIRAERKKGKA